MDTSNPRLQPLERPYQVTVAATTRTGTCSPSSTFLRHGMPTLNIIIIRTHLHSLMPSSRRHLNSMQHWTISTSTSTFALVRRPDVHLRSRTYSPRILAYKVIVFTTFASGPSEPRALFCHVELFRCAGYVSGSSIAFRIDGANIS